MDKLKQFYLNATALPNKLNYSLLFIFSIAINASFGYFPKPVYALTLFFLLLLVLNLNRRIYFIVTFFLTLLATAYFPIGQSFGAPNYTVITAAFYTNKGEAKSFLNTIPIIYYLGSLLILTLSIFIARLPNLTIKKNKLILIFVLLSIFSTPLKIIIHGGKFDFTTIGFTPVRFLIESYKNIYFIRSQYKEFKATLSKKDSWKVISPHPRYQTYILVIGESVRKDFMHNYGFSINNTPFISQTNGVFFNNYLSAGPATVISLTHTLAEHQGDKLQLQKNIINLAKKSGFYTWWISNQGYLGEYDTPVSIIGHNADASLFLQVKDFVRFREAQDKELLPFIQSALTSTAINQPKLIVVHLIGSHPPACNRTKKQFTIFFRSKDLSCYIQSIHNTDTLLKNITSLAKSSGNSWSMMYFSDHGLATRSALRKTTLAHSDKYQQNYRVPMFIISSDDTHRKTITAYRSALHFLYLFSQWTGINAQDLKTSCKYLSNSTCANQTTVLLSDKTQVDINTLPLNLIKWD